jgi:hypothetical protein
MPLGGAVVAGVAGLAQIGMGIGKAAKAKKARRKAQSTFDQNKYEIPESARASLQSAQRQASEVGLAGQDVMEAQLGQSTAQGVSAAQDVGTSSSDVLGMLSQMYGNQQSQQQSIGIQAAQQYQQNQGVLQNSLSNMANLEDQKWKYNVLYPYQQQMGAAGQMADQGTSMINSGMGAISNVAGGMAQMGMAKQGLNAQYAQTAGAGNPVTGGASSYQDYAKNMQQPSFNSYISGK